MTPRAALTVVPPHAIVSQLVSQVIQVRDPTGRCPVAGPFVTTERQVLGDTVLGYTIRLGGGVTMRVTPDWVVEEQGDRRDNVVAFRPRHGGV